VLLTARTAHLEAIRTQGGLRAVSRTETFTAPVEAVSALPDAPPGREAVLFATVQNPDLDAVLDGVGPRWHALPVVTWQNGIRAEERAAVRFPHLCGGVVRFTATLLVPGEVRLRGPGPLILGRWPRGHDETADSIAGDLTAAGFRAAVSPDIAADKALKLLVNLVSGPPVLLRRTGTDPALARVQGALLEEARAVLEAAGIAAYPAAGIGKTVDEMLEHFRAGGSPPDTAGGIYNSTWQNLHHRRARLENDAYHGEIVRLGARHGVPAPINARVLELLEEVRRRGLGPEPYDPGTFRERFADLVDLEGITEIPGEGPPSAMEI
jgi:2-dehydropantoate 2-reductase